MTTENENQRLILTYGIVASGKSTWAENWVAEDPTWRVRVNRDDLRFSLYGEYVLDRMREELVSLVQKSMVETALKAKRSVVVDDTNLTARFSREWLRLGQKLGVKTEFQVFEVSLDEALARNQKRADGGGRFVPEDVIRSFHSRFVNKKTGKLKPYPVLDSTFEDAYLPYVPDTSLPSAYLSDLDGTLADMAPCGRSPFDWKRVGEDAPIENVIDVVRTVAAAGSKIIFMSGRDAVCRPETESWLQKHVIKGSTWFEWELHMRGEDDQRKDQIVKNELFNQHVRNRFWVRGVFDDRISVARLWHTLGLTLFRVGDPDAEF